MLNRNWVLFWLVLVLLNGYFAYEGGRLLSVVATVAAAMALGASLVIGKDYWR